MNEVYSLQDIISRATELDYNSSFSFSIPYTVHNPELPRYASHVTHDSSVSPNEQTLNDIQKSLTAMFKNLKRKLVKYTSMCSDLCTLTAEYYFQKDISIDDCIIQWTKIRFSQTIEWFNIGIKHYNDQKMCMYSIGGCSTQCLDLTVSNMLFWLKTPTLCLFRDGVKPELYVSYLFRDSVTGRAVYAPVYCNIEYKIYHIPNGRYLKQLEHRVTGFSAKRSQEDKSKLIHTGLLELYYVILPLETRLESRQYNSFIRPVCSSEYEQTVNELVPGYYS